MDMMKTQGMGQTAIRALAVFLGVALVMVDSTIVNVALPIMGRELGVTEAVSTWLVLSYQAVLLTLLFPAIAFAGFMGSKRFFLSGTAVFTLASLGCTLSSSFELLFLFRMLQALGGAAIMSVNLSLVESIFPKDRLATGIGFNTATISVSIIVGPAIAGFILLHASWPWLFAFNIPLGLFALVTGQLFLPDQRPVKNIRHLVHAGKILVISLVLFAGFFGICGVVAWGVPILTLPGFAIIFGLGLYVLARQQRNSPIKLIPPEAARNGAFKLSLACIMVCFVAQSGTVIAMPFLFMKKLHFSIAETSLLLVCWPALHSIASISCGKLTKKISPSLLCLVGISTCTAGIASLLFFPDGNLVTMGMLVALCGLGYGLFQAPNETVALLSVHSEIRAQTGAILSFTRTLGQTLGTMLTSACFLWQPAHYNLPFALTALAGILGATATGARLFLHGNPKTS